MSSGSCVASQGAASASTAIASSSTAPSTSVGFLRSQRQRRRGGPSSTSATAASGTGGRTAVKKTSLSVADPRIEEAVAQVDQQVDQHVRGGREQQHALDHRVVVTLHRVDHEAADAGNREH